MKRAFDFLRKHIPIVLAGIAATVIAYFLFIKPSGQQQQPSPGTVSFPPNPGGGGGSYPQPGILPPITSTPPVPPYNVDWTILTSIRGAKLKALYTQLLNLETQINAATVAGNTALVTTLTNTLTQIQGQINSFVPPGKKPPPQPQPQPPPQPRQRSTTPANRAQIANSLDFFGKWLNLSPGAGLSNVQAAWQQTWQNYRQTPEFTSFLGRMWQAFLAGNPNLGNNPLGGPVQSYTGFRQAFLRQYDTLRDKPTTVNPGGHLRVA